MPPDDEGHLHVAEAPHAVDILDEVLGVVLFVSSSNAPASSIAFSAGVRS